MHKILFLLKVVDEASATFLPIFSKENLLPRAIIIKKVKLTATCSWLFSLTFPLLMCYLLYSLLQNEQIQETIKLL